MRPRLFIIVILLLLLILTACISTSSEPQIAFSQVISPAPTEEGMPAEFDLTEGAALYVPNCEPCHGPLGQGDGPVAESIQCDIPVFTARADDVELADWYDIVANGNRRPAEEGCTMPPWSNRLTTTQMWNVTAYVYNFAEDEAATSSQTQATPPPAPQETEEPSDVETTATPTAVVQASETFRVTGTVSNGTAGYDIPDDLTPELFIVGTDATGQPFRAYEAQTDMNPDGTYVFEEVPATAGIMVVVAEYAEVQQVSQIVDVPLNLDDESFQLDLILYETTDDFSTIHVFTDIFVDAVAADGASQTIQVFQFLNNSDRVYIGNEEYSLELPVPRAPLSTPGLRNVDVTLFEWVDDPNQPYLRSRLPVFPGEENMLEIEVQYEHAYDGNASFLHVFPYDIQSLTVNVAQANGLIFRGSGFAPPTPVTWRTNAMYDSYALTEGLAAGEPLVYSIEDDPSVARSAPDTTISNSSASTPTNGGDESFLEENSTFVLGLGILLIVAGGMYLLYDLQKTKILSQAQQSVGAQAQVPRYGKEELLQAVADLDEAFEAGELDEEEYQDRRAELKEELQDFYE